MTCIGTNNDEIFKAKKKNVVSGISIWCSHLAQQYVLLYDVARSETIFKCLVVEEKFIFLVCASKSSFLKLQDPDYEQDANQPKPSRAQ